MTTTITKTYWNNNGKFQAEYDEMMAAGFQFTKAENNVTYKYYRYFNDGDIPMGARYAWKHDIETYLEHQANIAVAKAYVRFKNGDVKNIIKFYSQKKLMGFNSYMEAQKV